jgi:hypothetical protein
MTKKCFIVKPMPHKTIVPFDHAAAAWFWYVRAERARRDGARTFRKQPTEARPCDPDDVYRIVMALHQARKLRDEHLRTLAEFGWREYAPDPRVAEEGRSRLLWDEALDRLTTIFVAKGIVRLDEQHYSLPA